MSSEPASFLTAHPKLEKPELSPDVEAELSDEKFKNRKHGSRATHTAGCHGPLCRRAEAIRSRRRNEINAVKLGREYQPNYRIKRNDKRNAELATAAEWHWQDLAERRAAEESARLKTLQELLDGNIKKQIANLENLLESRTLPGAAG